MDRKTRVFFCEQSGHIREKISGYLEQARFELRSFETGSALLHALRREPADILLLGLRLPDMDGADVLREVSAFSPVPVIVISTRDDTADKVMALELGADDYLSKPFEPRELLARIRAVLRARETLSSAVPSSDNKPITFHQITLRPDSIDVVMPDGEVRQLSQPEFRLLFTMARSPGRVFSRDQLLDQLDAGPGAPNDRRVDMIVARLRKLLGETGREARIIQTVRGIGYRVAREDLSLPENDTEEPDSDNTTL